MDQEESILVGQRLADWEVDEYPRHARSRSWYIIASIIGVVLILYAIATANFLFAVIVLMAGIITLISTFKDPDRIAIIVTTTGIVVGNMYYEYRAMKNFSIVYDPPDVKLLYVDFQSVWQPILAIPLEDVNPLLVRDSLLPYCIENLERSEETLTDLTRRLYKL